MTLGASRAARGALRRSSAAVIFVFASLSGVTGGAGAQTLQPFSKGTVGESLPPPWRVVAFPGGGRPVSRFAVEQQGAERVLRIATDKSYGNALHEIKPSVPGAGTKLKWRWKLDKPLLQADLKTREGDDAALKVCALFDLSLDKLGFVERNIMRIARSRTPDPVPAATLCYVWDHLLPEGSRLANSYSQRLRFVVMNSGEKQLGQWQTHERDLVADFKQAFGHETDETPPLIAIAVGADSDNTGDTSLAYVGDISLSWVTAAPSAATTLPGNSAPGVPTPTGATPIK